MTEQGHNRMNGAEALVRMLEAYGVRHIFGLCGDTTLPFYDALARLNHGITHFLTRDERHAAYMADGYARVTGRPGVCEGPSGGGATYILPGVVEANESAVPILAITSDVATTSRGKYPLTELDQTTLFRPLTKWNAALDDAGQLPAMIREAFRQMTTGTPGAVHLSLPFDTQKAPVSEAEIHANPAHTQFPAERQAPEPRAIEEAAAILAKAQNAIAICGGGPLLSGGEAALARLARALDMPVATTVSGQGAIAETDPLALGVVGSNGGIPATRAEVDAADVVLFIGCRAGSVTTERWRSPAKGTTILHIDSDRDVPGTNYDTAVAINADARLALEALADALEAGPRNSQNGTARAARAWAAKEAQFAPLAATRDTPIRPEAVMATLMELLGEDAIVVADPGTPCPYVSAYYRWRHAGRHFITNRAHGALGYSIGAAMGAHVGRPDVKTVALMGDGSFGFACGEFETMVRHRMPITSVVFSNATFSWIKAGQKAGFGGRYYNVDFDRTDHAAVARAFGVKAWTVRDPDDLGRVMAKALAHDGPSLVDIHTQSLSDAAAPVSEWVA
ncbi:thiamine pyrophosphate-binding protein [Aquicoccus porphyridii]|uniref:Thiamine pyrophosphate-binding protein n=1 Tax=Aquicoccus porphyridii TaxID=1852029 RepID=A0A5A9ZGD4_9RHOB|nr:thiamine pyrophosphate-binding protein [Aquicoccus porphyridii]KAA0916318.1 thiamine pyrophosphate-binding protein [Aquicoccus porphyridii]RAI53686.1 thiamine pyrophosphate-binding protein [Rhodobacteraceae bacterium AsT-22]